MSSGFIVAMKMKFAGKSIVWLPIVALRSSSTCNSAFCSFSLHRFISSKNSMPLFALNIFPGVNASIDVGPNCSAFAGSMSPKMSSAVRSGLPCILMNLSIPEIVFAVVSPLRCPDESCSARVFPALHFGHIGSDGGQLNPQLFAFVSGISFARFFASVVFPTPGGPRIMMFLFVSSADLNCCFAFSWPNMSGKISCLLKITCSSIFKLIVCCL